MNIKEIIQILRTATLNSITKKSLSESCLVQFEGICDAVEALKELDKPNIAASPQRTWVGLTGTEINHIIAANVGYLERMVKEVENLLRDKNT
jgi:RNA processing factor Prp31